MTKLKLLNDLAIFEKGSERSDGLGFEAYAEVLGRAAIDTPGPFTIGVFGEWGTGKTSLMNMTKQFVEDNSEYITVWFNAWRFEKEEHPIVPLLATIIRELERNEGFKVKLKTQYSTFIRALRAAAYGFSAKSKLQIPGFAEIEAGFVAKDMIDREEKLRPDPILERSLYYDAYSTLASLNLDKNLKIVVFIDDLDRCFPDKAIKLLESIKLVLCQPEFVFFLGVARSVIEGYLEHRYEKEFGVSEYKGCLYLDKIVQLSFIIPKHDKRMTEYSKNVLSQLTKGDQKELSGIIEIIIITSSNNPRKTVRFINALLLSRFIANTCGVKDLKIGHFAITNAILQNWPDLFYQLIKDNTLCKVINEWYDSNLNKIIPVNVAHNFLSISDKIKYDENLNKLLSTGLAREWLDDVNIRENTNEFLISQNTDIILSSSDFVSIILVSGYMALGEEKTFIDLLIDYNSMEDTRIRLTVVPNIYDIIKLKIDTYKRIILICVGGRKYKSAEHSKFISDYLDFKEGNSSKTIIILLPGVDKELEFSKVKTSTIFDWREKGMIKQNFTDLRSYLQGVHKQERFWEWERFVRRESKRLSKKEE